MMSHASLAQPPFVAVWLLELFTPEEHAESIVGDLLEEFSGLAAKSGVAFARRWYWRQSTKTVVRLIGTGFRVAPWSTIGAVLGGYLLVGFGFSLPEQLIEGVILLYRHHVTPYYTPAQWAAHVLSLNTSILMGRLFMSLVIGCLVAGAAKGREMVATITLGLVSLVLTAVMFWMLFAGHRPGAGDPALLPWIMTQQFCNSAIIIVGGIIVRESRSAMSRRSSGV
jgi:hypothetical protein